MTKFTSVFARLLLGSSVTLQISSALTATTTRYWDCSGGSCACSYTRPSLGLGDSAPAHCHSNAMFTAPANIHGAEFYGAAAISGVLGGGNWLSEGCGKCWKVTGTSSYLQKETTLVLKGTNYCPPGNPMCDGKPHFDIAAPGFDVLAYSLAHECPTREPENAAGFAACSEWLIGDSNPDANCNCSLFNDHVLRKGCENFYSLRWDNPIVTYEEVTCPDELARLHCDHPYASEDNMPDTCASNDYGTVEPPVTTLATSATSSAATTTKTTEPPATTTRSSESACCSWDSSNCGTDAWCNGSKERCMDPCNGKWMDNNTTPPTTTRSSGSSTTQATTQPPATTTRSSESACCSWDSSNCGTDAWCNGSEERCMGPCNGKWMDPNPTSACCSWNFSNCGTDAWCNGSEERCMGPCNGNWMNPK